MQNRFKKAFTLVELIVVITILAILGTIAFISLQGYSANARDSVRIANLTNMDKGLAILQAKDGTLPLPEGSITTITSSGSHILTQGEFTQSMAEKILKMSGDIIDPVDGTNPIYTTSSDKKYYQVALFLEAENLALNNNINSRDRKYSVSTEILQNIHAADGKTFISRGSKLGVIMTNTETPVNQDTTPPTTLELNNTTTEIAYLDDSTKIETSGTDLAEAVTLAVSKAGSLVGSCKDILDRGLGNTDGVYTIYPNNQSDEPSQVYCDMTTDGGGRTLMMQFKSGIDTSTLSYDSTYWFNNSTLGNPPASLTEDIDYKGKWDQIYGKTLRFCMNNDGIKCIEKEYVGTLRTFTDLPTSAQIGYGPASTGSNPDATAWILGLGFPSDAGGIYCEGIHEMGGYVKVRIGVAKNDIAIQGCNISDDYAWGFGLYSSYSSKGVGAGSITSVYPAFGDTEHKGVSSYIFIR